MARVAVVSGASGFIATELVAQLLSKGYTVRGTVRSTANKEKTEHLVNLADALPGTLELHEADLLKQGSFDAVVDGAHFVFHTASPFINRFDDPQKDLIDPAVEGTKNVLAAVSKHKRTVKRVVLTSSFAAVHKKQSGPSKPPRFTEDDWNCDSTIEEAYRLSKVMAERTAWDIAKAEGIDLVTICPTLVIGPVISSRTDATSVEAVAAIVEGRSAKLLGWLCDVRDVARAHVLAAETPSASGRHIISQPDTVPVKSLLDALRSRFAQYKFQDTPYEQPEPILDNSKALHTLGLGRLHDPTESIVDMAATLIARGIAKPQAA